MDYLSTLDPPDGSALPATASSNDDDWGDIVDTDDEYDVVEDVCENITLYWRGVCYPICIGEVIEGRYRIVHKLGHGSFSTVWMAYDMIHNYDVALKVLMLRDEEDRDYQIQTRIIEPGIDRTHLLVYHRSFHLRGLCGYHRVLVFPLKGPNLREYPAKKPLVTRMSFAVQLLQALKSLHEAEIVHADLNTANIMYDLRTLKDLRIAEKYKRFGRPKKMCISVGNFKDGEVVRAAEPDVDLLGDTIVLGDFGLAGKPGIPAVGGQNPPFYCAPERVHGINPSYASDMWSYMCIFFELYTTEKLFNGWHHDRVISSTVDTLGALPLSWKGSRSDGRSCDDTWYDQDRHVSDESALQPRLARLRPDASLREIELVLCVLHRGLSYLPEDRQTATELLEDASFNEFMAICH
ncbi:cmgc protein kinase [Fusarium austroafricanum]|uniref:Cmgc protein kinase n=1 Tax=Fusarium austroafricanum TaxID=2364996 RepID=A0A8H4P9S6_9HYPO|nr:cmgc protein kinase [Fusarium austroafricanum]